MRDCSALAVSITFCRWFLPAAPLPAQGQQHQKKKKSGKKKNDHPVMFPAWLKWNAAPVIAHQDKRGPEMGMYLL